MSYNQFKNVKQDKNAKGKYQAFNVNNVYTGSTIIAPKFQASRQHGLQSLGKVTKMRRGPLSNVQSLDDGSGEINENQSENSEDVVRVEELPPNVQVADVSVPPPSSEGDKFSKSWSSITRSTGLTPTQLTLPRVSATPVYLRNNTAAPKANDPATEKPDTFEPILRPKNVSKWIEGATTKTIEPEKSSGELSDIEREKLIKKQGASNSSTMFGPKGPGANGALPFNTLQQQTMVPKEDAPMIKTYADFPKPRAEYISNKKYTESVTVVTDDPKRISILKKDDLEKFNSQPAPPDIDSDWTKSANTLDFSEQLVFSDDDDKSGISGAKHKLTKKGQSNRSIPQNQIYQPNNDLKMHGGDVGRTSQTTTKRKPYQAVSQPSSEDVATSNNEAPPPRMTGNDSSNTIQPLLSNNPQRNDDQGKNYYHANVYQRSQANEDRNFNQNRSQRSMQLPRQQQRSMHEGRKPPLDSNRSELPVHHHHQQQQHQQQHQHHTGSNNNPSTIPPLLDFSSLNDGNWTSGKMDRVKHTVNSHTDSYHRNHKESDFFSGKRPKKEKTPLQSPSAAKVDDEEEEEEEEEDARSNHYNAYDLSPNTPEDDCPPISSILTGGNWSMCRSTDRSSAAGSKEDAVDQPTYTSLKTGAVWRKSTNDSSSTRSTQPVYAPDEVSEKQESAAQFRGPEVATEVVNGAAGKVVNTRPSTVSGVRPRTGKQNRNGAPNSQDRAKVSPDLSGSVPWTIQNEMGRIHDNSKQSDSRLNRRSSEKERRAKDGNYTEENRDRRNDYKTLKNKDRNIETRRNNERIFENPKQDDNRAKYGNRDSFLRNDENRPKYGNRDGPAIRNDSSKYRMDRNTNWQSQPFDVHNNDSNTIQISPQIQQELKTPQNEEKMEKWSSNESLSKSPKPYSQAKPFVHKAVDTSNMANLAKLSLNDIPVAEPLLDDNKPRDAPIPTTNIWKSRSDEKQRLKNEEESRMRTARDDARLNHRNNQQRGVEGRLHRGEIIYRNNRSVYDNNADYRPREDNSFRRNDNRDFRLDDRHFNQQNNEHRYNRNQRNDDFQYKDNRDRPIREQRNINRPNMDLRNDDKSRDQNNERFTRDNFRENKPHEMRNDSRPTKESNIRNSRDYRYDDTNPRDQRNEDILRDQRNEEIPRDQRKEDRPRDQRNDMRARVQRNEDILRDQRNVEIPREQRKEDRPRDQRNDMRARDQRNEDRHNKEHKNDERPSCNQINDERYPRDQKQDERNPRNNERILRDLRNNDRFSKDQRNDDRQSRDQRQDESRLPRYQKFDDRQLKEHDQRYKKRDSNKNRDDHQRDDQRGYQRDNNKTKDERPTQQTYQARGMDNEIKKKNIDFTKDGGRKKNGNRKGSNNSEDQNDFKNIRLTNNSSEVTTDEEKMKRKHRDIPVYSAQKTSTTRNLKKRNTDERKLKKDPENNKSSGDKTKDYRNPRYSKQSQNTNNSCKPSLPDQSPQSPIDNIGIKARASISNQNSIETAGDVWETASESSNVAERTDSRSKRDQEPKRLQTDTTSHERSTRNKDRSKSNKNTSQVYHISSIEPENPGLISKAILSAQNKIKSKASDAIRDHNEKCDEEKKRIFTNIDINNYARVYIIDEGESAVGAIHNPIRCSGGPDEDDDGFHEVISKRVLKIKKQAAIDEAEAKTLLAAQAEAAVAKKKTKRGRGNKSDSKKAQNYGDAAKSIESNEGLTKGSKTSRSKSNKTDFQKDEFKKSSKANIRTISPLQLSFQPILAPLPTVNAWTTLKNLFKDVVKPETKISGKVDIGNDSLSVNDTVAAEAKNRRQGIKDKLRTSRKDKSDAAKRTKLDRKIERPLRYSEQNREVSGVIEDRGPGNSGHLKPLETHSRQPAEFKPESITKPMPSKCISPLSKNPESDIKFIYETKSQEIPKLIKESLPLNKDLAHIWNNTENCSIFNPSSKSSKAEVYNNTLMECDQNTNTDSALQAFYGDDDSNSNVCKVMPQKQPMDSPNNALDSKTDIGVGPTGPPVAGVPTSGANGIPDVLSSDVTNVVDTSNASSSESNSLANMIPQDISSIALPREANMLSQTSSLSYGFNLNQPTASDSRYQQNSTAATAPPSAQSTIGSIPISHSHYQLPIGASLNSSHLNSAQLTSSSHQLGGMIPGSLFQNPELFLQSNSQNFQYRPQYNQSNANTIMQMQKSVSNASYYRHTLMKTNSQTQHNSAITSNYNNSQHNAMYLANALPFDHQMMGNNQARLSNSQLMMSNPPYHRPPPSTTLPPPPPPPSIPLGQPLHSGGNAQSSFYSQQPPSYFHNHVNNSTSLQAPIHQVTSPPTQYQIFGGSQSRTAAGQSGQHAGNTANAPANHYLYQRQTPKPAQPIHPQINAHTPMRDNETTYYAHPNYLMEPANITSAPVSHQSYKGRSSVAPSSAGAGFSALIDTSGPPPPLMPSASSSHSSVYESAREEQLRQKRDYIKGLSDMIASPSDHQLSADKAAPPVVSATAPAVAPPVGDLPLNSS